MNIDSHIIRGKYYIQSYAPKEWLFLTWPNELELCIKDCAPLMRLTNWDRCALVLGLRPHVNVLLLAPLRACILLPCFSNGSSHTTPSRMFALQFGSLAIGSSPSPTWKKHVPRVFKYVRQEPCHAVQNNTWYMRHSNNSLEHLFHMLIRQIRYEPQYLLCRGVVRKRRNFGHSTCGASAN